MDQAAFEPKQVSGWACLAIGVGFVVGLTGLIVLVRVLSGS
jgi:hypothetical protein